MAKQLFTLYLNRLTEVVQLPSGDKLQLGNSSGKSRSKVWAWVASEALVCNAVELPSGGSVNELVGFALEEDLIEPIEHYHIVVPERKAKVAAAMALTHQQMQRWCEAIHLAGCVPLGLFPDFLALPYSKGQGSLYVNNSRILLRSEPFYGLATSIDNLSRLLQSEQIDLQQCQLLVESGCQIPESLAACAPIKEVRFWQLLADSRAPDKKANLYQGIYTKSKSSKRLSVKPLIPALLYGLLIAALWSGQELQRNLDLAQQTQQLQQQNRDLLAQMLPEININHPEWRDQALRTLSSVRAQGESAFGEEAFWQAMSKVNSLMSDCDPCLIRNITYENDRLELSFSSYVHGGNTMKARAEQLFADFSDKFSWSSSRSILNGAELFQNRIIVQL